MQPFQLLSHVQLSATPWTGAHQAPLSMNSPGKYTGVGSHSLLKGIFLTQGLNLCLTHCRQIFYCLSYQGSPYHHLSPEFFFLLKVTLCTLKTIIPFLPSLQSLVTTVLLSVSLIWLLHIRGTIQYLSFCDRLLSLSIMSSGLIHIVALL